MNVLLKRGSWTPRAMVLALVALFVGSVVWANVAAAQDDPPSAVPVQPGAEPAAQAKAPAPDNPAAGIVQNCTKECHQDIKNHKVIHAPSQIDCANCHVAGGNPKDHKFFYIVPKEELCKRCHNLPHEATMHKPVVEGNCLGCHDPHGSDFPKVLRANPKGELCMSCHKEQFSKFKFIHGPVAIGACTVCHKPHSSSTPKLLVQDAKTLCLTCHSEVMAKGEEGVHMHAALEQGCVRCHDPHASNHKYQLVDEAPGLCMQCHKEKFDQMTAGASVVHGAITEPGGCTGCHEPHSSKLPALQRGVQPGTCLACHDKTLKGNDGSTITDMAALLAANPDKHGPIREGACTACHNPHAGKNFRLLIQPYPAQFYAPFSLDTYKLCFTCHIPDLVLKASGRGLTQFRDGDKNLHWLHVNQEKGRTCRACHEVHASTHPSHIRDAVPFGNTGWMLELNYQQTAEGGSCAPGCHKPRSYNRTAPVNRLGVSGGVQ